jgi:Xaa-Pro aminopeptidase
MGYRAVPAAERARRLAAVRAVGADRELDALLFVGVAQVSENRGKGWLSWLFGYTLEHRYGYGLVSVAGAADMLVFPEGMTWALQDLPAGAYRCPPYHAESPLADEVAGLLREWEITGAARIGVIGLSEMLPVADYQRLRELLPDATLCDVSRELEPARQTKTAGELAAIAATAAIADAGWATLRDHVAAGVPVRQLGAEVYRTVLAAGAVDSVMLALSGRAGSCGATLIAPSGSDHVLAPGDVLTFSMELTGQEGYWVEQARQFALGPLAPGYQRLVETCVAALERFGQVAVPGATGGDVYRACDEVIRAAGLHQGHTPGHSLGQDVLEQPRIAPYDTTALTAGTVLAFHPHVLADDELTAAYLADVFVVAPDGARPLSAVSRQPLILTGQAR